MLRGAILPLLESKTSPLRWCNIGGGADIEKLSHTLSSESKLNLDAVGDSRSLKSQLDLLGINLVCT